MKTFRFYQDVLITTIRRDYYNIEADTLENARVKASKESRLDDVEDAEYIESELKSEAIFDQKIVVIYDSEGEEI